MSPAAPPASASADRSAAPAPRSAASGGLDASRSTYLRAQAQQPVPWRVWSADTKAEAAALGRPLLLSIGYAACHGCRQMDRDSYDDPALAALIDAQFVPVKIDREQRPDLDLVYQAAHRRLRRSPGGWPLTVFCAPDGTPFYSGTHFPPQVLRDILGAVQRVWTERRDGLARQDAALRAALADELPPPRPVAPPDAAWRDAAVAQLAAAYDARHGGFGPAPKFAHPTALAFLLARGRDEGDGTALRMALDTLRHMAAGGLYDQLGGGFFRYGIDAAWALPQFEKLLSDSALLLALYAEALTIADEPLLRRVVDDTAGWLMREMRGDDGLYAAAQAADDAHGLEGGLYLWDRETLRLALTPNEWDVCAAHWGLLEAPTGPGGRWHLRIARHAQALAQTLERPAPGLEALIASARLKLRAARDERGEPLRDGAAPTASQALVITGLARAGAACGRADWLAAARAALGAVRRHRFVDGRLQAQDGVDGFLDDHAFLLEAVLALHAAAPSADDLPFAEALADALQAGFEDTAAGGFWFTRHDAEPLVFRPKPGLDAATPSGNGTAALALQALGRRTGDARRFAAAERCVRAFAARLRDEPASHTRLLQAAWAA